MSDTAPTPEEYAAREAARAERLERAIAAFERVVAADREHEASLDAAVEQAIEDARDSRDHCDTNTAADREGCLNASAAARGATDAASAYTVAFDAYMSAVRAK